MSIKSEIFQVHTRGEAQTSKIMDNGMDFGFLQAHGSSPSSAASTTSAAPSSTAPCETCRSGRPARPSHVPQARRGTGGRRIHAGRREGVHEDPRRHLRDEANDPERQPPRCSPRTARGSSWLPTATNWRQLRKICIMELLSARRVRSFAAVREEEAARPAGPSRRLGCARDDDDDDDGSGTTPRPHQACRRVILSQGVWRQQHQHCNGRWRS
ncbi:hypothetical protein BDA96_08G158400 [Sorghum bicolor]|uniref:Uncharacterized protein n=2 Tax=Sorghum bicolor TaxID=4558 RepID=A0A921QG52_SORBI|nr:hypothetical protein BDA96_08G158400 [Sorghum bicolor]